MYITLNFFQEEWVKQALSQLQVWEAVDWEVLDTEDLVWEELGDTEAGAEADLPAQEHRLAPRVEVTEELDITDNLISLDDKCIEANKIC